jgi:hypothetical protein
MRVSAGNAIGPMHVSLPNDDGRTSPATGSRSFALPASTVCRESPMLRLNPAIAMVCPKRTSHPAAALPRRSAPQCQHRVRRQHAKPRRPPDRTSGPESLAIARMPDQRGCNGKPLCQPSQPPHEYGPGIRPKDATDKEARTPRSRGRSVVVLYNGIRAHRSLNKDAPVSHLVQRAGVIRSRAITIRSPTRV